MTGMVTKGAGQAVGWASGLNWLKIAKFAIPAIAVLVFALWLRGVLNERAELRQWQGEVVAAVGAEIPDDACKTKKGKPVPCITTKDTVVKDVQWLGRERRTIGAALESQSAKLLVAQTNAEAAVNAAAAGRKAALQRNEDRERTRKAILDPKRTTGLTAAEWGKL